MGNFFSKKSKAAVLGFSSRAEDVAAGIDASHLTAIITGGNSGIGAETVRVLVKQGARVVIAARNTENAEKLRVSLLEQHSGAKILCMPLDLSSLRSVRRFAEQFLAENLPLNILINNAGIMFTDFGLSSDGIEQQFATNHLGHFLLTNLLLEKMRATAIESGIPGRIIILSSVAHSNLMYPKKPLLGLEEISDRKLYSKSKAYGHSKMCNVLHAKELARRLRESGEMNLTVNAVHPGLIDTGLWKHSIFMQLVVRIMYLFSWKSVEQGAATTIYAALRPEVKGMSGEYLEDCKVGKPHPKSRDPVLAKKLWTMSEKMIEAAEAEGL